MDTVAVPAVRPLLVSGRLDRSTAAMLLVSAGQTIEARVLEAQGSRVTLLVNNRQITAESQAVLAPGDQVKVRVTDVNAQRVIMQLVSRGDQPIVFRSLSRNDIATVLQFMGLAVTRENVLIAEHLLARNMPVDRENIEGVYQGLLKTALAQATTGQSASETPLPSAPGGAAVAQPSEQVASTNSNQVVSQQVSEGRQPAPAVSGQIVTQAGQPPAAETETPPIARGQQAVSGAVIQLADELVALAAVPEEVIGGQPAADPNTAQADQTVKISPQPTPAQSQAETEATSVPTAPGQSAAPATSSALPADQPADSTPVSAPPAGQATTSSGQMAAEELNELDSQFVRPGPTSLSPELTSAAPGLFSNEDIAAAVFLKSSNLPITPDTLAIIKEHFTAPRAFADQVEVVENLLSNLAQAEPDLPPGIMSSWATVRELAHQIQARLPAVRAESLLAQDQQMVVAVKDALVTLGVSVENKLLRAIAGAFDRAALDGDLRVLLARLADKADEVMNNQDSSAVLRRELAQLRDGVRTLLGQVEYSQLANSTDAGARPVQNNYYLFQIPLFGRPGESQQPASLKVYYRGEQGKKLDINNIRVVFRLEMQNLKTLEIDLMIHNRQIDPRISSLSKEINQFIAERTDELDKSLKGLGFQMNDVHFDLLDEYQVEDEPLDQQLTPVIPGRVFKVDFRV